jgi:hypothetical protein
MTRPRPGGGGDGPSTTGDGSSTGGPGGGPRRGGADTVRPAGNVSQAQDGIQDVATRGRSGGAEDESTYTPAADGADSDLPPGYTRDDEGNLRGPDGRYASDPNRIPPAYNRDSQYPGGYRQSTHDEMIIRYTDEGSALGAVPRDANGDRIPRSQLTWRDQYGEIIDDPGTNLTYEHRTPVVEHWNTQGYNQSRPERIDFYNDLDNLVPMHRSENSSGGGSMTTRYRQDPGDDYSP